MNQQYTVEQIKAALHKSQGLISLAAEALGANYTTIYRRVKKSKELREIISGYRLRRVDRAEIGLDAALARGEPWAIALVLKTLGKNRGYVEREEHTGKGGGPIETSDVGLSDDERAARIAAILDKARARRDRQTGGNDTGPHSITG